MNPSQSQLTSFGPSPAGGGDAEFLGQEPLLRDLRSVDPRVNARAWNAAYPLLWSAGMRLAGRLLAGGQWEAQREDVVATAIAQVMEGLMEDSAKSFNQISGFGDLVSMTQTIVRRRIMDFYRQQSRSREDAVEELPEPIVEEDEAQFSPAELLEQILALDPPKPELFRDRFFDGLTTREVAARRNMPHGTVLTHFADGLRLLRGRLTQMAA
jgi:RNA polymerase sigma factor (sigma-70 family)